VHALGRAGWLQYRHVPHELDEAPESFRLCIGLNRGVAGFGVKKGVLAVLAPGPRETPIMTFRENFFLHAVSDAKTSKTLFLVLKLAQAVEIQGIGFG
jgi:hypothetical protein